VQRTSCTVVLAAYAILVAAQYAALALPGHGHFVANHAQIVIDAALIVLLATVRHVRLLWKVVWWISLLRQTAWLLVVFALLARGEVSVRLLGELALSIAALGALAWMWRPRLSEVA
jgi:hypothetical protein